MPQSEKQATDASAHGMPFAAALNGVVKGLYRDPILLFGIGAGILLVAVLAVTTSLAVVLVVAGLFVVVLVVGARQRSRAKRGADVVGRIAGSRVRRSRVGKASKGFIGRIRALVLFSSVEDSEVGVVGDDERRRPPAER